MAKDYVDTKALFGSQSGWSAKNRPSPYDTWENEEDERYCSCYNNTGTAISPPKPSKLFAPVVKALLSIANPKGAEIGVCRISNSSYASQMKLPDGRTVLATAQINGTLSAAIVDVNGLYQKVPSIGHKTDDFDVSSILALYICLEAERSRLSNNIRSITWDQIRFCQKEFEATGLLDKDTLYLFNDALYYGLSYKNGIPGGVKAGNINMLVEKNIKANEFASATIICGKPDLLVPSSAEYADIEEGNTIEKVRESFKSYIESKTWSDEEEAMIPVFPDNMIVPPEVLTFARRFVKSRGFKVPINNMCWRGGTGFGKSTGAEILACILHTPFVRITCSSQTELNDFLSQFVPNSDATSESIAAALPDFDDIQNDPVGAYEALTGKIDEEVDVNTVMKARDEALINRSNAAHFKLVVSPFVTALEKGWIVEPSEFGRIRDSATLVGLNNFDRPGSRIPLPTGGYVKRHRDALVLWTDNVGYVSARPVDPSFMRRMDFVIDSYELAKDRVLARIKDNTGFDNDHLLDDMYEVWSEVRKYCKDHEITEGDISIVELERWVQLVQIEGESNITSTCREAVVSKACSDPDTLDEIMDACVAVKMASLSASI